MPRIRTLKPEIISDEKAARLPDDTWRLFVSMITMADDYGTLPANPKQLDAAVFWSREETADVPRMLRQLVSSEMITLYRVRGQSYVQLSGWKKHQKVDHPGKPIFPGPEHADKQPELFDSPMPRETLAKQSRETPVEPREDDGGALARPSRLTGTGTGTSTGTSAPVPIARESEPGELTAYDLIHRYGIKWRDRYQMPWAPDRRASNAARDLLETQIGAMTPGDRVGALAELLPAIDRFLADQDPKAVEAKHPFTWFVERFNRYRTPVTVPTISRPRFNPAAESR